jgi:hypothetical protein
MTTGDVRSSVVSFSCPSSFAFTWSFFKVWIIFWSPVLADTLHLPSRTTPEMTLRNERFRKPSRIYISCLFFLSPYYYGITHKRPVIIPGPMYSQLF